MRSWLERNFRERPPIRDDFISDVCGDTAFLLISVLYPGLEQDAGTTSNDSLLNILAWVFCSVPGYDLSRADAKKNLNYLLVEFQKMASQSDQKVLPFLGMTDKMRLLFTVSSLRSGYLRPLLSMIAISLAMLDDQARANCYPLLRSFVAYLSKEIEISVDDLQAIVADLAGMPIRLRLGGYAIVVPDDETVSVLQSAVSVISNHKKLQSTMREFQPEGAASPQVANFNGKAESVIAKLTGMIGLEAVKKEVVSLANFIKVRRLREAGGLKQPPISMHLVFSGNPGTGKTTVARMIAELYKELGVLTKGHLVEIDRRPRWRLRRTYCSQDQGSH